MKKIIVLSLLMAGTLALGGCSLDGSSSGGTRNNPSAAVANPSIAPVSNSAAPTVSPAASSAQAKTVNVQIKNFSFNPFTVTIKKGDTVTWVNNDSAPHLVKAEAFISNRLNQGQSFSFTFNEARTFDYLCSLHPSMLGKIIVE